VSDLYEALQVHPSAEPEVIEAAYRRLARKYHPDVNRSPDAAARMALINSAYSVLANPQRRAAYDLRMSVPPSVSPAAGRRPMSESVRTPPPPPPFPRAARSAEQRMPDLWLGGLIAGMAPVSVLGIALFRNYAAGIIGSNRLWLDLFLLPAVLVAAGLKVMLGRGRPFDTLHWGRFGAACLTAGLAANLYTWLAYRVSGPNGPDIRSYWLGLLLVVLFGYAGGRFIWDRLAGRHNGGVRP